MLYITIHRTLCRDECVGGCGTPHCGCVGASEGGGAGISDHQIQTYGGGGRKCVSPPSREMCYNKLYIYIYI